MMVLIVCALCLGTLVGRLGWLNDYLPLVDNLSTGLLCALLFVVGVGLGNNKVIWRKLLRLGWRVAMIPLAVAVGSLLGALLSGFFLQMPFQDSLSVGAGFGWYSLSGLMIKELGNVQLGAIALLANCFREIVAMLLIPLIAKYLGKITAIAPGGATCMDTTMPVISKCCGESTALLGFISGSVLTALVPILVPIMYSLGR